MDEQFQKYQEDTTADFNKLTEDTKKDKDADRHKIWDLEKQLQDIDTFNGNRESFEAHIKQLEMTIEDEKKDK